MSTNILKSPNYFTRLFYYLKSSFTLFFGIKNFSASLFYALKKKEFTVHLKNGQKFKIRDLMELWTIKETILDDAYLLANFISKEKSSSIKNIVDIGGALGDFSIFCAKKYPNSTIYVFEPQNDSCQQVKKNIALNNIPNNQIVISNTAISNFENIETFTKNVSTNGLEKGEMVFLESDKSDDESIEVNFTNLGIFIEKLNQNIDILKIDCEGGEYNIIPLLKNETYKKINLIVMEWHEFYPNQNRMKLFTHLENVGFNVTLKKSPVHNELGYIFAYK